MDTLYVPDGRLSDCQGHDALLPRASLSPQDRSEFDGVLIKRSTAINPLEYLCIQAPWATSRQCLRDVFIFSQPYK